MTYTKVLYIGPYREFSGAGNSARNYIHALYKQGYDLCIAPIFCNGDIYPEDDISSEILPLENNHLKSYDIVIQHCHPFEYVKTNKADKNIGIFQFNSTKLHPAIYTRLSLLDKIVVNSMTNMRALDNIADKKIHHYCPELIDGSYANDEYKLYDWNQGSNRAYTFYMIGDFVYRKNFIKAIHGYINAFNKDDNVQLIIKTKPNYLHNNDNILYKEIEYEMSKIYDANKIDKKRAPTIKIMLGKFSYQQLLTLHFNGDCLIDISMGENFGFAHLEASLLNKNIIVNSGSASNEIPSHKYSVLSKQTNVYDPYNQNFIENRPENIWSDIDIEDYIMALKHMYMNRYAAKKDRVCLDQFTYSNIEQLIC